MAKIDRVSKTEDALVRAYRTMAQRDRLSKTEDALVRAYHAQAGIEPDSDWNLRVMARVRVEALDEEGRDVMIAQRFVWRFAAAACSLALVLSLYAFKTGIGAEQFAMKLFIDGPLNTLAVRIFTLQPGI